MPAASRWRFIDWRSAKNEAESEAVALRRASWRLMEAKMASKSVLGPLERGARDGGGATLRGPSACEDTMRFLLSIGRFWSIWDGERARQHIVALARVLQQRLI